MRSVSRWWIAGLVFAVAGCQGGEAAQEQPEITPDGAVLWPGMEQRLEVRGVEAKDLSWSASGGRLFAQSEGAVFVAPSEPGEYVVEATRRDGADEKPLTSTLRVAKLEPAALELDDTSAGTVAGRRGRVRFTATRDGKVGARARFELLSTSRDAQSAALQVDTGSSAVLEVRVVDELKAELTFGARTLDGNGALTEDELATLRAVVASGVLADSALIALDAACADRDIEPRLLAALLFPVQMVQKYLTPDREAQTRELAKASACRYFEDVTAEGADERPSPELPLLANGQSVPFAFGYLPLDEHGAATLPVRVQALSTDKNVYGPGRSMCRGACGADCEENNCGEPEEEWRCSTKAGRNTGEKELFKIYTCGEHPGCIEHDECFDNCNASHGFDSWDAAFCMRACDFQAASGYGAGQGLDWARGYGPFTHDKKYEYSTGLVLRDETACPLSFPLTVSPESGLAPHRAVIAWSGEQIGDTGDERCRLDFGDGSPTVDIEPCKPNGEYEHLYATPSEMYDAKGVYTVKLTRIGAAQTATADVQARWRFDASPQSGRAPLVTGFTWTGFTLVEKKLTCTLDFGDGSAPQVVDDCAKKPGVVHTYQQPGVYQAQLTVRGGDRPLRKTLTIEVKDKDAEEPAGDFASVKTWRITYAIDTIGDKSWTELGGVNVERIWREKEMGSILLDRTHVNGDEIVLEGTGDASSSFDFNKVESSPYFREERWDKGAGTSTVYIEVRLNTRQGRYDVYFHPGDFACQYGGSRTSADGSTSSYGPSDEELSLQPAPIPPTGELTEVLPKTGLTIAGDYSWEDYYAYEAATNPDFDAEEVTKKAPNSGRTTWTIEPVGMNE